MTTLPAILEPLTPPECDVRSFPFMPLHVGVLRDSGIAETEDPEAFRCAVLLWAASWHQVPAASLKDDDREMRKLAGLGRDQRRWQEVKEEALRGFVRCSDGRLYHPFIAKLALQAWATKRRQRAAANARWGNKADDDDGCHGTDQEMPRHSDELPLEDATADAAAMQQTQTQNKKLTGESGDGGKSGGTRKRASAERTRAQRIPLNWEPTETDITYAVSKGFTLEDIPALAEEFFTYWRGAGVPKIDWAATWRNNIIKRVERLKERGNGRNGNGAAPGGRDRDARVGSMFGGAMAEIDRRRGQTRGSG